MVSENHFCRFTACFQTYRLAGWSIFGVVSVTKRPISIRFHCRPAFTIVLPPSHDAGGDGRSPRPRRHSQERAPVHSRGQQHWKNVWLRRSPGMVTLTIVPFAQACSATCRRLGSVPRTALFFAPKITRAMASAFGCGDSASVAVTAVRVCNGC